MTPDWFIFATVINAAISGIAIYTAYKLGQRNALKFAKAVDFNLNKIACQTEYNNGRRKGYQEGIDFWKARMADRAREAARRDGKGRFAKGGGK